MGGAQSPQQLIPTYESSTGSSGDANASLNSSTTNTTSTTSTSTRQLNRKHHISDDEVIFSVKSPSYSDYDLPVYLEQKMDSVTKIEEETEDFLPICDALFNVICLVGYFCDIVFDVLAAYSFYQQDQWHWAVLSLGFILTSMVVCQLVSLTWYWQQHAKTAEPQTCSKSVLVLLHLSLCGVLWRYFKLFIPVDIRYVKSEVRDLCLLRLIHAFLESAPMLLIQLYLTFQKPSPDVTDLTLVSTTLSLFTLCWALASYSKNIRRQNVHKLVLTWLGVIFQFLWRLGTVTARVTALAVYATVYSYWLFLVLILHWFCMLLWIMSPRNIFSGEKMSGRKKTSYCALISAIYLLCFINVQEVRSRQKVIIFYVTMFLENSLLVGVWLIGSRGHGNVDVWYENTVIGVVFGGFLIGILFMTLYYSYFHVRKLSYSESGGKETISASGQVKVTGSRSPEGDYYSSVDVKESNYQRSSECHLGHGESDCVFGMTREVKEKPYNKLNGHHIHHPNVPGVFNCRFNPAIKRKKKKPSSFVPPPLQPVVESAPPSLESIDTSGTNGFRPENGKMAHPFWKRPQSVPTVVNDSGSEHRLKIDIHQKLQAKKEQQLADLKVIEEEIRQGKLLNRPSSTGILDRRTQCHHVPPPGKQPPWYRALGQGHQRSVPIRPPIVIPTGNELMLDPHYLLAQPQHSFYDNFYEPVFQTDENMRFGESVSDAMEDEAEAKTKCRRKSPIEYGENRNQCFRRCQGSLPVKQRRSRRDQEQVASTNSSDADVDSGEDDDGYEDLPTPTQPIPTLHQIHPPQKRHSKQKQPETPL